MIGPGTGLAPFRGFIQERDHARKEGGNRENLGQRKKRIENYFIIMFLYLISGKEVGDTILYFGCRKREEDFLYKEELEEYVKNGTLKLHTAFSRDQAQKEYVTHLLERNKDELWNVIGKNNGHIYICG